MAGLNRKQYSEFKKGVLGSKAVCQLSMKQVEAAQVKVAEMRKDASVEQAPYFKELAMDLRDRFYKLFRKEREAQLNSWEG